jgi:hypothetical protein
VNVSGDVLQFDVVAPGVPVNNQLIQQSAFSTHFFGALLLRASPPLSARLREMHTDRRALDREHQDRSRMVSPGKPAYRWANADADPSRKTAATTAPLQTTFFMTPAPVPKGHQNAI